MQRGAFVRSDVLGLVALDLVLWIIRKTWSLARFGALKGTSFDSKCLLKHE